MRQACGYQLRVVASGEELVQAAAGKTFKTLDQQPLSAELAEAAARCI